MVKEAKDLFKRQPQSERVASEDLELVDLLLREETRIVGDSVVVSCSFNDFPDLVVYARARGIRWIKTMNDKEAERELALFERLAERVGGDATCTSESFNFGRVADFVSIARRAIEETGEDDPNTPQLLESLDRLLSSN